ncbi:MAG: signal peptidase I [Ignisphaera sp.]|uniref:Signal peptidase I n=1 Tax=Ignisphaera aggregans TaxID=334771 RepID=A0A7C4JL96_9CREN
MIIRRATNNLTTLFSLAMLIILFFVPNIAILIGGILGTYVTYFAWSIAILTSLAVILDRRGLNYLNNYSGVFFAGILITIYTIMGFFWGFSYRVYPKPSFLLIGIALFLIKIVSAEISRSLSMGLIKQKILKILIGVLVGLFYGKTYLVFISDLQGVYSKPMMFMPSIMYNLLITLFHLYGGFTPALIFRVIIDGYWEFFPLTLHTQEIGIAWRGLSMVIYYGLLVYVLQSIPSLKGISKEIFKPKTTARKIANVLPTTITITISVGLLAMILNGVLPLVIISGSMRPLYDVGDIVFVKVGEQVKLNDVVAYKLSNGLVVVHRIIEVRYQGYILKGDANPDPDPYIVKKEQIIGKIIGAIPRIGWIAIVLREGFKHISNPVATSVLLTGLTLIAGLIIIRRRSSEHRKIYKRF